MLDDWNGRRRRVAGDGGVFAGRQRRCIRERRERYGNRGGFDVRGACRAGGGSVDERRTLGNDVG